MTQKTKVKNSDKNRQMTIIGGIVVAAIAIFGIVLYFASPNVGSLNYDGVYAERTEDGAFILGDPDAPITVVAWEDFLCPHCQSYQSTVKKFIQDYVFTGQARFEFRMLPISTQSQFIFGLVECAAEVQDDPLAFWPAHDAMFRLTTTSGASFDGADFAREIGVPYSELLDCAETADQFQIDQQLASQQNNQITGTPAVAWRDNTGRLRLDVINRQPNNEQLANLVEVFGQLP
ncbi:MAG: thioredoxin domain-containing protein [Chloroflexota bacterium]